ncbi:element excision factor XisI family protein [Nostoc sp.]|uniref:element excision factor XisI family protein n=1 Tax=Nostoc sp. TaxID=1180 RepID=UPI002FF5592A
MPAKDRYHQNVKNALIKDGCDGTEDGVATELVSAGVPKNRIVLGFRSEELRKDSEFAIA